MKKSILFVLAFVFLMVLLSGCAPASTPIPPTFTPSPIPPTFTPEPTTTQTSVPTNTAVPFPTGTFKAMQSNIKNAQLKFLDDGTYRQVGGALTISGTYTVDGDKIVFTEIKNSGSCGDFPATYIWSFDGRLLNLKTVENKCPFASIFSVEGQWTKQP